MENLSLNQGFWLKTALVSLVIVTLSSPVLAKEGIDYQRLANAIYKAENSPSYPYGIMVKYKHTSPRQACLNTIKKRYKLWDGRGDFIAYLSQSYCPLHASNDPRGLNANWVKNVTYYYNKGELK